MKEQKAARWKRLDNAAKIFPPTSNRHDTKVFRFTCRLNEMVQPIPLQRALDKTIKDFPIYQSIIRKGLFWYYFETSNLKPLVSQESKRICAPLYHDNRKNLLFKVTYYKKRINLEIYHALTDGAGAMQFLRALVLNYLMLVHVDVKEELPQMDYDASWAEKEADSFDQYYDEGKVKKEVSLGKGFRLKGDIFEGAKIQVINGVVSVKSVLQEAHKHDATLTAFLCSVLIYAIATEMSQRDRKKPIVVSVPVNLRTFFQSNSARNFFSTFNVPYQVPKEVAFDAIVETINAYFKNELTKERFRHRLNKLVSLERSYFTRFIPLALKKPTLKIAHHLTNREITTVLSNIGKVNMPEITMPYIDCFDVCVSTEKIQVCICSFKDKLSLSFTSPFLSTEIQKNFFRELTKRGIDVIIDTNLIHE